MNWLQKISSEYNFSSVQFNLPQNVASEIKKWGIDNIDNADVYSDKDIKGREDNMHVTIKYGLHTDGVDEVKELVKDFGPFDIKLDRTSRFTGADDKFDVVKVEVLGDKLRKLHSLIGNNLKNSDSHPVYKPHITVSYIKKGCCQELSSDKAFFGKKIKVDKISFNPSDGKNVTIKL